jgi:hypothetical protein
MAMKKVRKEFCSLHQHIHKKCGNLVVCCAGGGKRERRIISSSTAEAGQERELGKKCPEEQVSRSQFLLVSTATSL